MILQLGHGYAAGEIFEQIMDNSDVNKIMVDLMEDIFESQEKTDEEIEEKIIGLLREPIGTRLALLSDPGEDIISRFKLNEEFCTLTFKHHSTVRVGVGFSLGMFWRFAHKPDIVGEISRTICKFFKELNKSPGDDRKKAITRHGIDINEILLNKLDVRGKPSAEVELVQVNGCDNPRRRGDVVFVHGLNGDPRDYWGEPGSHWPAWLGEEIPDVGVWSLGYENAAFKQRTLSVLGFFLRRGFAMPLFDRAMSVLLRLEVEVDGIGNKPLVFITHSMGGLLIKQLLRTANDSPSPSPAKTLVENTKGVCFIATPHIGSDLAKWVSYFGTLLDTTVAVDELKPHQSLLRDLTFWYRCFVETHPVKTLAFYETKPVPPGVIVVEPGDADPGVPHRGLYPLDEDHRTICKPKSKQAEIYLKTLIFVRDCLNFDEVRRDTAAGQLTPSGT